MPKDPAFLFYPNDFLSGTQFMTDEQVGKYMRLLMAQHQHGHLSEDQVIFICKSYDKHIFSKLKKDSDGLWYNERLEIEIEKRKNYVISRSKNKEGKTKAKIISKSYDLHMENRNENEDVNDNTKYIIVENEKVFDALPVIDFYQAQLNGTQKEFGNIAWRPLVPEWFSQHIGEEFNDAMHAKNSFKKFYIARATAKPNGKPSVTRLNLDGI